MSSVNSFKIGKFQHLVRDLQLFDNEFFFKNLCMSPVKFEEILKWIGPLITKSSKRRPTTSPAERLIITLCYLPTGHAQFTISSSYRKHFDITAYIFPPACSVFVEWKSGLIREPEPSI